MSLRFYNLAMRPEGEFPHRPEFIAGYFLESETQSLEAALWTTLSRAELGMHARDALMDQWKEALAEWLNVWASISVSSSQESLSPPRPLIAAPHGKILEFFSIQEGIWITLSSRKSSYQPLEVSPW